MITFNNFQNKFNSAWINKIDHALNESVYNKLQKYDKLQNNQIDFDEFIYQDVKSKLVDSLEHDLIIQASNDYYKNDFHPIEKSFTVGPTILIKKNFDCGGVVQPYNASTADIRTPIDSYGDLIDEYWSQDIVDPFGYESNLDDGEYLNSELVSNDINDFNPLKGLNGKGLPGGFRKLTDKEKENGVLFGRKDESLIDEYFSIKDYKVIKKILVESYKKLFKEIKFGKEIFIDFQGVVKLLEKNDENPNVKIDEIRFPLYYW